MKYTNNSDIPLALSVWLATDDYQHNDDPMTVSVTSLLRPTKQVILGSRVPDEVTDISSNMAARMGTAYHEAIEKAWINNHANALSDLGIPKRVIDAIRINPIDNIEGDTIPIYLEKRTDKEIEGWTVSGQFDMVLEGRVCDIKSTSVYTYIKKSKDKDYIEQGSIYRWLNQDIITGDDMSIFYIFPDWNALKSKTEKGYPPHKMMEYKLPLLSLGETEALLRTRLGLLSKYMNSPESDIPECTSKELWMDPPKFAYYKNPDKKSRSTKNFDTAVEAYERLSKDGNTGVVEERKSIAKACTYCSGVTECNQAKRLIAEGRLVL